LCGRRWRKVFEEAPYGLAGSHKHHNRTCAGDMELGFIGWRGRFSSDFAVANVLMQNREPLVPAGIGSDVVNVDETKCKLQLLGI